jgi:hypothetical protein
MVPSVLKHVPISLILARKMLCALPIIIEHRVHAVKEWLEIHL